MKQALLVVALTVSTCIASQPMVPDVHPDPEPDFLTSLPETLASGANYFTLIPLHAAVVNLEIHNQASHDNHILMIGVAGDGTETRRILVVQPEERAILTETQTADFDLLYLISMQAFHVQSERQLKVLGIKTRHFATVTPTRHLELIEVENDLGKRMMVGVTRDGSAYYPVYGYKLGTYDASARRVIRVGGVLFEVEK